MTRHKLSRSTILLFWGFSLFLPGNLIYAQTNAPDTQSSTNPNVPASSAAEIGFTAPGTRANFPGAPTGAYSDKMFYFDPFESHRVLTAAGQYGFTTDTDLKRVQAQFQNIDAANSAPPVPVS